MAAEIAGERITGKTNDAGIATFPLMNRDTLSQLTAWTDDFKIGGYSFNRDPPRDPLGGKFTIELDRCRPQTIRIVNDEDKAPVADLGFVLTVGTGPPDYQYVGKTPDCEMKTNKTVKPFIAGSPIGKNMDPTSRFSINIGLKRGM